MTVLITLTIAGTDTGPFDLYSDVDGFVSAFETGVSKAALLAGYSSSLVPNGTSVIRIKSSGVCTNYIDVTVTTTTTTTSSTSSTSTTTTTTTVCPCVEGILVEVSSSGTINYLLCEGGAGSISVSIGPNVVGAGECIQRDSLTGDAIWTVDTYGACCTTTTTTSTSSTTTTTTTAAPTGCTEFYNNTASNFSVTYVPCGGTEPIADEIGPGQSFCAVDGTCGGDCGFLTILGPC
jgi:hypothetical protein